MKFNERELCDFHIHSDHSIDGKMSVDEILSSDCEFLSITDHDTMNGVKYLQEKYNLSKTDAIFNIDGKTIIPGVEVTCRLPNIKKTDSDRDIKIHLLVYGAKRGGMFDQLLGMKYKNDLDYDFAFINYILKKYNIECDRKTISKYLNSLSYKNDYMFSKKDLIGFLDYIKFDHTLHSKQLMRDMRRFDRNKIKRLDLNLDDVINLAHESGGICVVAHPQKSLSKSSESDEYILNEIINMDVDGFEYHCETNSYEFKGILKALEKQHSKKFIYTSGSDTHIEDRYKKIGYVHQKPINYSPNHEFVTLCTAINKIRNNVELSASEERIFSEIITPNKIYYKPDAVSILKRYEKVYRSLSSMMQNPVKEYSKPSQPDTYLPFAEFLDNNGYIYNKKNNKNHNKNNNDEFNF